MKWYQFHLSTMIIVMLAAGILLGMNLTPQPPPKIECKGWETVGHTYGWPSDWHDAKVVRIPDLLDSQAMWFG